MTMSGLPLDTWSKDLLLAMEEEEVVAEVSPPGQVWLAGMLEVVEWALMVGTSILMMSELCKGSTIVNNMDSSHKIMNLLITVLKSLWNRTTVPILMLFIAEH